jgi:long-subunit fatty acid transport protein
LDNGEEFRGGSGGLAQLYLGAGYELFKGLSLGANFSYLFGTTTNSTSVTDESSAVFNRVMEVRDWNVQVGLQYALHLGTADRLVFGATYQPNKSLHGHTWGTLYDLQDNDIDTVGYTSLKGKYELPHTIGVGVSYEWNHRLLGEVDFTYQKWADAKYSPLQGFEEGGMKFDNRWKAAAGLQYTPNRRGSYVGAMMFRVGGFYNHDYMNIRGNNVRDYGASIGVGLPVPSGKTMVNIGLEWKHRYTAPTSLIKEDYLNITIGVNVNEMWFWKNKIR